MEKRAQLIVLANQLWTQISHIIKEVKNVRSLGLGDGKNVVKAVIKSTLRGLQNDIKQGLDRHAQITSLLDILRSVKASLLPADTRYIAEYARLLSEHRTPASDVIDLT